MAKMERERAVKDKRAKKQERKEEKKAMREAGIDPMAEFLIDEDGNPIAVEVTEAVTEEEAEAPTEAK
jgi:hypothetical protein